MKNIVLAFGSVPKDGGTFTFYRNLRTPLLHQGVDIRCVTVGHQEALLWDKAFADDGCVLLAPQDKSVKRQARAFSQWCKDESVDVVMGVNSSAILSSLPHLSSDIRIVSRCANAFDHGYRITVCAYERLSRIIALAPRQIEDLVSNYGVDRSRISLIPNGTCTKRFENAFRRPRGTSEQLRLGFLGRLEHSQKGVLHLPKIVKRLKENDVHFSLSIAGKGVHEAALRRELRSFVQSGEVQFLGTLRPDEIAKHLAEIDLFLFPSHFEGSPNALIEAMMAGCAAAAWYLKGITDFLIEDGVSGILANPESCSEMADRIASLDNDRDHLRSMGKNAGEIARQRFDIARVADDYARLINEVMAEPPVSTSIKSWNHFRVEPAFYRPWWRRLVPNWLKKGSRRVLFNLRLADRYE